jgi:hypothetical protein
MQNIVWIFFPTPGIGGVVLSSRSVLTAQHAPFDRGRHVHHIRQYYIVAAAAVAHQSAAIELSTQLLDSFTPSS